MRDSRKLKLGSDLGRLAVPMVLLVAFCTFALLLPDTFPTHRNIVIMLSSNSVVLLLALALTIPLRAGDFDLSVAATMGLSAAIVAVLTVRQGVPVPVAVLVALGVGVLIGVVNGAVVVWAGVNAFIATLGMLTMLGGLAYAVTSSELIVGMPDSLQTFSRFKLLGMPAAVWYGWVIALVLLYIYEHTPAGRYLLFVGGNREAAALSGLRVKRIRFTAFVAASTIAAFAGVVLAGSLGAVDPTIGPSYLLPPYAAAFLGTTMITVGRFNVIGTMVGLYFITVVVTGLQLLGAEAWTANVFNGAVLIAAVLFANVSARLAMRADSATAFSEPDSPAEQPPGGLVENPSS